MMKNPTSCGLNLWPKWFRKFIVILILLILFDNLAKTMKFLFRAYDEIAAIPSVEQTIKIGSSDVEMVVQAANNK